MTYQTTGHAQTSRLVERAKADSLRRPGEVRVVAHTAISKPAGANGRPTFIGATTFTSAPNASVLHPQAGCYSVLANVYSAARGISGKGSGGAGAEDAEHSSKH